MNLPPIESAGALLRSMQNTYPDDFVKKLIRLFGTKAAHVKRFQVLGSDNYKQVIV